MAAMYLRVFEVPTDQQQGEGKQEDEHTTGIWLHSPI